MGYEYKHSFSEQQQRVLESLQKDGETLEDVAQRMIDEAIRERADLDLNEGFVVKLRESGL